MSQKSLWAKFPRAIYAFLLGLLDGKAALESTPSRFGCLNGHPSTRPIQQVIREPLESITKAQCYILDQKSAKVNKQYKVSYAFEKLSNMETI